MKNNRKETLQKLLSIAEHYKSGNLYASGAITDMGIILDDYIKWVREEVAERAKIKMSKKSQFGKYRKWQNVTEDEVDLFDYEVKYEVDKQSITNTPLD